MIERISRRHFLATAAVTLAADPVAACDRRYLRYPIASAPPSFRIADSLPARPNIMSLDGPRLDSLRRGVAAMRALPRTDRRSWAFQAAIHGTADPTYTDPLFNQCQHSYFQTNLRFLPWHRGYLYFFERVLRWAANDPGLMLPFWDWTTYPVLPEPYRYPADSSNPLYEAKRKANDGSALPGSVVVDDLNIALGQTDFPTAGPDGFSPDLEDSPHGQVHTLVGGRGGLMTTVPTSAGDPIFWLHHANIDRLWNVWLNQGDGRANITDSTYLDTPYTFADETGGTVTVRIRDIINSAALGYQYEGVPNPPVQFVAAKAKPAAPRVVATSPPPGERDASLEKIEAKPLGFEERRVKLNTIKEARQALVQALTESRPMGPAAPKVSVVIEGLSAETPPDFVYRVYVNLPEGERSENVLRRHYVGSINFFGKTRSDRRAPSHEHGTGDEFNATFDATRVLARFYRAGRLDPDALTVTILPIAPTPPGVGTQQVRAQAAAAAKEAKVSYKRRSVRVSGGG
jgi:tyrosinase